ncbi:MAG TPA: zinc ABC transporter substrate-binding protein [Acidimicrobiales bacterium]|jgi:zinc/manganese transport system substrate-binding protein
MKAYGHQGHRHQGRPHKGHNHRGHRRGTARAVALGAALAGVGGLTLSGLAAVTVPTGVAGAATSGGRVVAVGAENEYANVIGQIGGPYVTVSAVMSNPNTDPHSFESSPKVAAAVAGAQLVVQNGLGYDDFMDKIEQAAPDAERKVIDVQTLLHLPASTPNPHLWYKPTTMPAVAKAIAAALSSLQPAHRAYFAAQLATFDAALQPWATAIAGLKAADGGVPVATTEPVADYLLQAAGLDNRTPFTFQADIMNGVDPSPQDVSLQDSLFSGHKVRVFVYNEQVTDSLTDSLLQLAHENHIPVVGVYETMPTPGYDYQSWMVAEVKALVGALGHGTSSPKL